ncbi:MAG TPA: ATP-binding protein [Ktedonobacteraceae bacterium]
MSLPLPLRLTLFYTLLLGLCLAGFGYLVYHQASQQAYNDLDNLLKSRAASIRLGKDLLIGSNTITPGQPFKLPGVDELGSEGVAVEIFDAQLNLLATTSDVSASNNVPITSMNTNPSPVPWDARAIHQLLARLTANSSAILPTDNIFNGIYSTVIYEGQIVRVYTTANNPLGTMQIIQTAHSELSIQQTLEQLRQTLFLGGLLGLLLALSGGLCLTWSTLAALRRVTRTAHEISLSQNFKRRVSLKRRWERDEITTLAETFNTMLANLDASYQQQKRFVADASHELRAPITSIRCNLDLLARVPDLPGEEQEAALADARTEADRMGRLVNHLLTLARADEIATIQGEPQTNRSSSSESAREPLVDLDSLVLEVFRQYRGVGGEQEQHRGPRLTLQHITPVQVHGAADQLKQAVVALIDNALKYTPAEGSVTLALSVEDQEAILKVCDTGIGIAPEDLPHIFERFYRADLAHSRDQGGSGLGLAIAASIIQTHHGQIDVESKPGQGSIFSLRLPSL